MGILPYLESDPAFYVTVVVIGLVSTVLHELGHVFAALRQGDETPRLLGHVTMNPVVHMGWFSIVLLLVGGIAFGATPVNPQNFRGRHGRAIVSVAGPLVNILIGLVGLTVFRFVWSPEGGADLDNGSRFLLQMGVVNIVLFLFNLLPLPPLDGSQVVAHLSPRYAQWTRDPATQPIIMGGFVLAFLFAGRVIWPLAEQMAVGYLRLLRGDL